MPFASQPVRRVAAAEGIRASGHWPHTIPAVRQLLTNGLDLDPGVTFLVGENGAGKSTLPTWSRSRPGRPTWFSTN
jgi:predicted ATPase